MKYVEKGSDQNFSGSLKAGQSAKCWIMAKTTVWSRNM